MHKENRLTIQNGKDDIGPISDILNRHGRDLHNHVVEDPIARRRHGRSSLTETQGQDLRRVHPNGGLESDGEGTLEDEEHCRRRSARRGGRCRLELDLVDQGGLDGHHGGHESDHGQQQGATADPIDEQPWDEGGDEEPGLQVAGHERRHVLVEADLLEDGGGVVDDGVDAAELLHRLDAAGDQESPSALQAVALEEILPSPYANGFLNLDHGQDVGVEPPDRIVWYPGLVQPQQYLERLVRSTMAGQPSWRFRDDQEDEEHGYQEDALQDARHPPRIAAQVRGEAVVDPVGQEDAQVQGGKLHADVETPACFRGVLGLKDWDGAVDDAHAKPGDDAGHDHVRSRVSSSLQESSKDHDDDASANTLLPPQGFTEE